MRFQRQQSPPPYLNRRDQKRMLAMCILFFLVVVAIDAARKPENWNWFFALSDAEQSQTGDMKEIDFRVLEQPRPELKPDEFLAVATAEAGQEPAVDSLSPPEIRQFSHPDLSAVGDQRLGFLRTEQPVLDALLEHVRNLSPQDMDHAGDPTATYRVVNVEPEKYRGRLLTITGTLRRYSPFDLAGDAQTELTQGWIFTEDSGNNPWFVLCTDPTPDLQFSDQMETQVRVSGYFFKRYGYPTATGSHVAPLLIARQLEVLPVHVVSNAPARDATRFVMALMCVIAALFGLMVWRFSVSDRRFNRSKLAEIADQRHAVSKDDIAALNNSPVLEPGRLYLPPDHSDDGVPERDK